MKKIFSLLILVAFAQMSMAATDLTGHFHMDLSNQQIPAANIGQHFYDYLDLPDSCIFELFRDTIDTVGYHHLSYVQLIGKDEVFGGMVFVHALNDMVQTINGDIRTRTQPVADAPTAAISARQALRRVGRNHAPESEATKVWVKVMEGDRYVWHKAYRIKSGDMTRLQFVDVYTGEVVTESSLVCSADVEGTAYTMYSGVQPFSCYQHTDGRYYLIDPVRQFITYDATNATPIVYPGANDNKDSTMQVYRQSCELISNPSSTWDLSYHRYLRYFTINELPCWESETRPSLYLTIYNSSDSLLYVSGYKEYAQLPARFNIPDGVETLDGFLKIYIYDYYTDSVAGDDYLCYVTTPWSRSNEEITFSVENVISAAMKFEEVGLQPALDIHWGMQQTIDYYRAVLHRNGHDNQGGALYQYYNPQPDEDRFSTLPGNAFANYGTTPNYMAYGLGELTYKDSLNSMNPLVGLDVMAHEFTHLVTGNNGHYGLQYQDESGALNESFSDLMAMGAVKYITGACDWTIGGTTMTFLSNMRSLADPFLSMDGLQPQPKFYQGQYWYSGDKDHGGVHTNSGVQNYWFYLLCEGGSGTNEAGQPFNVTGIGLEKGTQIAYLSLMHYLTTYAAYPDARWGSEQAAKELYGANSQEYRSVVAAWEAVGVDNLPELEPTALSDVPSAPQIHKILRNGQVLILRDGVLYNTLGQPLRPNM